MLTPFSYDKHALSSYVQTKLRIGLVEQTLLAALGHAAHYTEKHSSPPARIDSPLEEVTLCILLHYDDPIPNRLPIYNIYSSAL